MTIVLTPQLEILDTVQSNTDHIYYPDLLDAIENNLKNPTTFHLPDQSKINTLVPGDIVKVCDGKERFWVVITEVKIIYFIGIVDNNLLNSQEYDYGSKIAFAKNNIYDIYDVDN